MFPNKHFNERLKFSVGLLFSPLFVLLSNSFHFCPLQYVFFSDTSVALLRCTVSFLKFFEVLQESYLWLSFATTKDEKENGYNLKNVRLTFSSYVIVSRASKWSFH